MSRLDRPGHLQPPGHLQSPARLPTHMQSPGHLQSPTHTHSPGHLQSPEHLQSPTHTHSPEHIYLHAPFCRARCPYCDYAVLVSSGESAGTWLDAVVRELELRRASGIRLDAVRTVLLGGGTPSLLGAGLAAGVRERVLARSNEVAEWTVEANPEDVHEDLVDRWVAAGVTRVSLGVQSLRPEALAWLGRRHDAERGRRAMEILDHSSVSSWNVDVLFGLPITVDPDPVSTVEAVVWAGAPHISLYELTLGPGNACAAPLPEDDEVAGQYLRLHEVLSTAGYDGYQMTAFARPGHNSAHAEGILVTGSWLGIGPGAHSRLGGRRSRNLLDWRGYTRALDQGQLPLDRPEPPDRMAEKEERIHSMLLRSAGVPSGSLSKSQLDVVDRWVGAGHAARDRSVVRLTPSGWLLLDRLARELVAAGGGR